MRWARFAFAFPLASSGVFVNRARSLLVRLSSGASFGMLHCTVLVSLDSDLVIPIATPRAFGCGVCLGLGEFPGPLVGRVAGVVGARQIRPATPVGWLVGLLGSQRQIMKN